MVIDCLRADILRPYGGEVDFFTGKTWMKAFAPSGWTLPSHASIFTGVSPLETGIITHHDKLGDKTETLAEAFRDAGFFTFACVNNNNLLEQFGFNRGFEHYSVHRNSRLDLDYDRVFLAFCEALARASDRPFFAFLHTNIVHDYFFDTPWSMKGIQVTTRNRKHPFSHVNPEQHDELRQRYYNCVIEAVAGIKRRILPALPLDETLIVVTSDHGEGLWAPRFHHGGRLHNDLLHVPLVVLNETGTVAEPFGLVNLKSWILARMQIRSSEAVESRPIVAYDGAYLYLPDGARLSYKDYKSLNLTALINWPIKTITASAPDYVHLEAYNLDRDFGEAHNLLGNARLSGGDSQCQRTPLVGSVTAVAALSERMVTVSEARGNIDAPDEPCYGLAPINVRGWALLPGKVIDAIARIGRTWTSLKYPVDRPDVAKAFPEIAGASLSGFSGSLQLPEFSYREGGNCLSVLFRYLDNNGSLQTWEIERTIEIVLSQGAELKAYQDKLYQDKLAEYHRLAESQRIELGALHAKLAEYDKALSLAKQEYKLLEDQTSDRIRELQHRLDGFPSAEALAELYTRSETLRQLVAATTAGGEWGSSPPAPKYQGSGWYPAFVKIKPLIPKAVRKLGREALVRIENLSGLKLDPARDRRIQRVSNLKVIREGIRSAAYLAEGPDPQIVFATGSLPANSVKRIRFRLRRAFNGPAFAQLFWTHSSEEGFSENNSAKVALDEGTGSWHEYTFVLDDPKVASKWNDGGQILQLRFDPTNVPGAFEMGPLEVIGS